MESCFQEGALFSSLTVCQNIEVPLREMIRLPESLLDWIAALRVATVGLPPDAGLKYPAELSGGMEKSEPVWLVRWRWILRCCSLMNRPQGWIR